MTQYFTHYWSNDTWKIEEERGGTLEHCASNLFLERKVDSGDRIYVVTVLKGELFLAGHIVVDRVVTQREARLILHRQDIWDARDHIIANDMSLQPFSAKRVSRKIAKQLLFESGQGLKYKGDKIDEQTLRGVRKLTTESARLLDSIAGSQSESAGADRPRTEKMTITQFFDERLGARLKNPAWSWGAIEPHSQRIFLRVWADQIARYGDGEKVQIYWYPESKSAGNFERIQHVEAIEHGAEAIGVVCTAFDTTDSKPRKIKTFDRNHLLLLGEVSKDQKGKYARIIKRFPTSDLAISDVTQDVADIVSAHSGNPTTTQALVSARIGQGAFRKSVLKLWNNCCSVTGSATTEAIRASHIKPWRDSTDQERLDPKNGLPLIASLDALFDAGLISFGASGEILVSVHLSRQEREIYGVSGKTLLRKPTPETASYLAFHRSRFARNRLKASIT